MCATSCVRDKLCAFKSCVRPGNNIVTARIEVVGFQRRSCDIKHDLLDIRSAGMLDKDDGAASGNHSEFVYLSQVLSCVRVVIVGHLGVIAEWILATLVGFVEVLALVSLSVLASVSLLVLWCGAVRCGVCVCVCVLARVCVCACVRPQCTSQSRSGKPRWASRV